MVRFIFYINRYNIGIWSENSIIGCFDPVNRNSYSVNANIVALHSLMRVDNLISIGVNNLELAEIRFIFFSVGCFCNNNAPIPVFEASVKIYKCLLVLGTVISSCFVIVCFIFF